MSVLFERPTQVGNVYYGPPDVATFPAETEALLLRSGAARIASLGPPAKAAKSKQPSPLGAEPPSQEPPEDAHGDL